MQKIIPLSYKVKLWKSCLSEDKIKRYSTPEYFKERLEEEFRLTEHIADPKKIFVKKCSQKDVSLEESIDIDVFNDKTFIFTKFKYWDKVAENDNWKVAHEWEIVQVMSNIGSLLTDFYFGMDFSIRADTKFLIIEWTITTIQKSNEQMKAQILHLLKDDLYLQDDTKDYAPEYAVDFKFEEQEISRISEKVKKLELVTEIIPESQWEQAESWTKLKNIPINISVWWWMQDQIIDVLKTALSWLQWVWNIRKRAVVKQWQSTLRSDYSTDGLKLALKDSFLYSHDSIDYEKFKQETYKYIFPGMDFED